MKTYVHLARLVLPVVAATLVSIFVLLPLIAGSLIPTSLPDFSEQFAVVGSLHLIGLLVVGLPVAMILKRRATKFAVVLPLLLVTGLVAGTVIVMIFFLIGNQGYVGDTSALLKLGVLLGAPAGLLAATLWSIVNRDMFAARTPAR